MAMMNDGEFTAMDIYFIIDDIGRRCIVEGRNKPLDSFSGVGLIHSRGFIKESRWFSVIDGRFSINSSG